MTRDEPTRAMTLGNMRQNACAGLTLPCRACGRRAEVNVDSAPSSGPRLRRRRAAELDRAERHSAGARTAMTMLMLDCVKASGTCRPQVVLARHA
jgi:hypothetical protein